MSFLGHQMYKQFLKRFFDITLSLIALIVFSPLFVVLTVIVYLKLGSPIIFTQTRVGKNEKTFKIYKFRSMLDLKDDQGQLLPDEKRVNSFGMFLRKSGLDELPELINVIRGDMSLVGPRPLLENYLNEYSDTHKKRHNVRPGVTGLAQVNGRNAVSWKVRLDYDIAYVQSYGLIMDLKILFKTFFIILSAKGSTPSKGIVMEEYKRESNE